MDPPGPSRTFTWPEGQDTCWVTYLNIFLKLKPPTTTTPIEHIMLKKGLQINFKDHKVFKTFE